MEISLSINSSDLLSEKEGFLENLITRGSIFRKGKNNDFVFSSLKEAKIDGIELVISEHDFLKIEAIRSLLNKNNFKVFSIHQPILRIHKIDFASINNLFKIGTELSARVLVIHLFALGKQMFDPSFVNELKSLENKYNIKIGVENSTKNLITSFRKYCYSEDEFSSLINKLGFNITLDTTHLGQSGGDIIKFFLKNKKHIVNIHLSDFKKNIFNTHLPLGKGVLPIDEFLTLLKKEKYNGLLTLEINSDFNDILKSINYVKNFFNNVHTQRLSKIV